MSKRISILYTELADYSLACFRALKEQGVSLQLIHWPINPEAPFQFDLSFVDEVISRDTVDRNTMLTKVDRFGPDLILCSGWMDKDYVAVCRKFKGASTTVLSLDNHWTGSWKQHIARVISPITLKRFFDKAFVPGEVQKKYAIKLGFAPNEIKTGFYSADVRRFEGVFQSQLQLQPQPQKEQNSKPRTPNPQTDQTPNGPRLGEGPNPQTDLASARDQTPTHSSRPAPHSRNRRFLYLGRYVHHTGIFDLWKAFQQYRNQGGTWELCCIGTGDQYDNRVEAEGIKHFGFVQPSEMAPILQESDVYILPSHFEPWGVSVHEMAVAGFPMLLSDAIGAREAFLQEGKSGSVFPAGDAAALAQKMKWISSLTDSELQAMGRQSHELGVAHSPEQWVQTLLSFL